MRKFLQKLLLSIVLLITINSIGNSQVVISQVYGGAGCGTVGCSTFKNDFIEIFNRSASPVSLTGWSVQYASATGTAWQVTALPSVTLQPGQYLLIAESFNSNGINTLPTPDVTGTIAMSATAAKIALVNSTIALSGACPVSATIIDLVGYGSTASCSETSPSPAPGTTTAVNRSSNGCTDANNNSTDFTTGTPNPRNTASSFNLCGAPATNVSVAAGTNASEPATSGTFTITLSSAAPAGGVTVNYSLNGSATLNTDYSDALSGIINIPQGSNTGTITLTVIDDLIPEPSETINITLNSVTSPYIINTGIATINLNSNDIAPISLTSGTAYTQDFNTLSNTGTTNSLSIPGWQLNETGNGARYNQLYAADNGSSTTGDTYSYGTNSSTDRALGSLQSGTLISSFGAYFINNTGTTITSLKIVYTGEQWRLGTAGRTDILDFQYSTNTTNISSGTWTDFNQLDFTSPVITIAGAKDGNAAANKSLTEYTIHGLSIAAGAEFFIRWNDFNASGGDDGLAIDDFSIEANPIDVSGPVIKTLSPVNTAINVPLGSTLTITFNEDIQKGAGNIYIKRLSDGSVAQTINVSNSSVTVTENKASFVITSVIYSTSYYIELEAGTFKDVSGNNFTGITGSSTWSFTTEAPPPPGVLGNTYSFNTCVGSAFPDGFTQFSTTGSLTWACTAFGHDPSDGTGLLSLANGVQMNGFAGGTNVPNTDWFISPPYDLTSTTYPLLSFWSRTAFNGLPLHLKVSTDYNGGDPSAATWTDLNGKFPGQTSNVWTNSANINLSAFKQSNVHFAFVYTSTDDDGARWTLDDISIINSATPPPPSLTVSTTDVQYTYVAAGSVSDKTFSFIGNDLTDDVTLTSTSNFLLSKDGTSFSSSLTYTLAEANNVNETVYVRFAPSVNNQDFTGTVNINTSALSSTVSLKGTSINPVTTLEVVNWNIEWFGSTTLGPTNDNQQEQNVKTILQNLKADVYALTEVVSEARLANIVSQMPGYSYVISNYGSHTNTSVNPVSALAEAQKLAFIYKTSVFSNVSTTALLSQGINSAADLTNPAYNYWASGRFPFMMSADVTLNCVTKNVKFVLVHAKANTSPTAISYERRKKGADTLYYTLQQIYTNDNVVILGDYNDDLDQSITAGFTTTSWNVFKEDVVNFDPLTLPLSIAGKKSTVSYNDVIDHVVVSNEMQTYYLNNTASILTDVTSIVSNYGSTTTDHYPVFTRYRFSNSTAPTVNSCTSQITFCAKTNNSYTIPAFVATDDCGDVVNYTYTITGATERTGASNDASGTFSIGTSFVNWIATDSWGNTSTCQTTVVINPTPTVTIPDAYVLPSGVLSNTVYIGYSHASTIILNAAVSGGTPAYTYSWTSGSVLSSTTVSPLTTTTYTVTVTDANSCQAVASKTVNVIDIRAGKKLDKVTICHSSNSNSQTLVIDGNAVATHLAHGDNLGTCNVAGSLITQRMTTDHLSTGSLVTVKVLPNPSANYFTLIINRTNKDDKMNLKVIDVYGRIIELKPITNSSQMLKIGESYLPGIYFAEISEGKEKRVIKLLKL